MPLHCSARGMQACKQIFLSEHDFATSREESYLKASRKGYTSCFPVHLSRKNFKLLPVTISAENGPYSGFKLYVDVIPYHQRRFQAGFQILGAIYLNATTFAASLRHTMENSTSARDVCDRIFGVFAGFLALRPASKVDRQPLSGNPLLIMGGSQVISESSFSQCVGVRNIPSGRISTASILKSPQILPHGAPVRRLVQFIFPGNH